MGDHQREDQGVSLPGLYRPQDEHDSCGIGFVADIKGRKSHDILNRGLEVLERMEHRGAESADNKTGDGAGVLLQIPHSFYAELEPKLPKAGEYGTGLVFLPSKASGGSGEAIQTELEKIAAASGLTVVAWRDVPTDPSVIGAIARKAEPAVKQVFLAVKGAKAPKVAAAVVDDTLVSAIEKRLFIFRKRLEKAIREGAFAGKGDFHFPSFSSRTIVYKGMLMSSQLRSYFTELSDPRIQTSVALVHSRFSTNTFPSWSLAQPFRMVAHNGEINTIKGNRFWMTAREALFSSPEFGDELKDILPIIEPGKSDSASFDNALELLVMSGRSLPHALMMLIPESWNDKNPIPQDLKSFYEYHATFMEPWDGPASMVFCDGRFVGGTLDRNGLRPSRYTVTKNDLVVMASETGVQDFKADEVAYKGRLLPGKLLLVDMEEGRIIPDAEVKSAVCRRRPYVDWVKKNVTTLEMLPPVPAELEPKLPLDDEVLFMERSFGYTREDRDTLLLSMAESGQEPTSSMGTDTPVAVFSDKSQRLYNYFKQVFAQVTNPPIDSIREELVMTLTSYIGRHENLLSESEEHCRSLKVLNPILTPVELAQIRHWGDAAFRVETLDATFYVPSHGAAASGDKSALETALDRLVADAEKAVDSGATILVLSDKSALDVDASRCAIPSLMAVGAVHHGLIRSGRRMLASLVVESAEPREVMHFALLFGYGADLIVPYGALAVIADVCKGPDVARTGDYAHAEKNYLKGSAKAILKIISKMGTSTLRSYRGAQIFEAIGLGDAVIDKCFNGTASRIGGVGFRELEAELVVRLRQARSSSGSLLPSDGQYRWRKFGEKHAWNPETIHLLQWATREGDYKKFKEFTAASDALNKKPHVIRGLIDFAAAGTVKGAPKGPIPLDEVESIEEIMKRFTTGAMSFGSISKEAHEAVAIAMNSIKGRSNSGEGGEDPERFAVRPDGTWARSAIKQVASGRFGVTSNYLANAIELQIKIAQGAKPGEGGQLPGHKVDALIARTRNSTAGVTLISPPPHHDIYSIEDLAELIFDLKNANPTARISVKLVSETGVGTIAAGVAKAHADNILISGYDGGTGASPQSSIRHAGLPWEIGLAETHQTLVLNGLRGRVRLQTDGQIKSGRDIVIAGMLGAEEFGFGTSTLIVMGCVMMRKCHENTCPMGVATQDPELRKKFTGKSEHLVTFFRFLAEETREYMAQLGFKNFDDLIGRSDLLVQAKSEHSKAKTVDLSRLLYKVDSGKEPLHCVQSQMHKIDDVLDRTLIDKCLKALDKKVPAAIELPIKNTDRAVGAMLSYEVSKRFGEGGLPDNFVTVDFSGSAGQSFGAFLAPGITFRVSGDVNDYLGKGLSGGRLVIAPPESSTFKTNENILVGNTALYGATRGEVFAAGVAGERFCVRNSGAIAVVEGTGDHCAEYMTGGRLVVLGRVGRNFAAGMSGGIAYVLDRAGELDFFLNKGMVELSRLDNAEDENFVKEMIRKHVYWTGSTYAKGILDAWSDNKGFFIKVLPVEYKRALQQMMLAELDRKLYEIREQEDIAVRA
ncbi:MAG: glutamate synthase large subunit [Treponemataceae bacterium]